MHRYTHMRNIQQAIRKHSAGGQAVEKCSARTVKKHSAAIQQAFNKQYIGISQIFNTPSTNSKIIRFCLNRQFRRTHLMRTNVHVTYNKHVGAFEPEPSQARSSNAQLI